VRDLGTAVNYVLHKTGLTTLNLIGMSWGGTVTGWYTTGHNDKVARLALIAPQWLADGPTRIDAGGTLGAHRRVSVQAFRERWLTPAPEDKRDGLVPAGVFEAWAETTLALTPRRRLPARSVLPMVRCGTCANTGARAGRSMTRAKSVCQFY
jgi:pimeloyl-ACP methyl ester carboxylesterase